MKFLSEDFLLDTTTAQKLYHEIAARLPIIDYHCHLDPREIAENVCFENLTHAWLSADHYKWRAMRMCGVPEDLITGNAPDKEKFLAYAACMPSLIGNPLYHWSHLELWRYCGIDEALTPETAEYIWEKSNVKLKSLPVRVIMEMANVEAICTTDDPISELTYHRRITEQGFQTKVLPAFRPDKALNIENGGWREYISALSAVSGVSITGIDALKEALLARMKAFEALGCRAADHGLTDIIFLHDAKKAETAFRKAMGGECPNNEEAEAFRTELLLFCGGEYAKRGWVMELHFGVLRNVNAAAFAALGTDVGYDIMGRPSRYIDELISLLNELERRGALPKTILFSLNPSDNAVLCALSGAFGERVQPGSAWWFNDTLSGMREHMKTYASMLPFGRFLGFLTDSRSFLSYTRHEYFRRLLCGMLGEMVEDGEYPNDMSSLKRLVADICYENVKRWFGF